MPLRQVVLEKEVGLARRMFCGCSFGMLKKLHQCKEGRFFLFRPVAEKTPKKEKPRVVQPAWRAEKRNGRGMERATKLVNSEKATENLSLRMT